MKRLVALIFILFLTTNISLSEIITGQIDYNYDEIEYNLFETEPVPLNKIDIINNLYDSDYKFNNQSILKGNLDLKDRKLAKFTDNSYGIIYKNEPQKVLYYNQDGILTHIELKSSLIYPYKTYKYNKKGQIVNFSMYISNQESYVFDNDKNLIAHWKGDICLDKNDNIIMQRKIYD